MAEVAVVGEKGTVLTGGIKRRLDMPRGIPSQTFTVILNRCHSDLPVPSSFNSLNAFINAVEAQTGKALPYDDANYLIQLTRVIVNLLSQ
jgi:hypothetical protein